MSSSITPKVEITIGQFIDNIEKNGLPKANNHLFGLDNGVNTSNADYLYNGLKVTAACAFGQGLINSGAIIYTEFLHNNPVVTELYEYTYQYNDTLFRNDTHFHNVCSELRELYTDRLDEVIELDAFDYSGFLGENYAPSKD